MRAGVASVPLSTTVGWIRSGSITTEGVPEMASPSYPDMRVRDDRRIVLPPADTGELDSHVQPFA